ncbi:hypothetical protein LZ30DRAFT_726297 [Colletotrichum cereale]|nr:hypothetical protein LZ30DRAFT_726297 [Colletotrichum cereale]
MFRCQALLLTLYLRPSFMCTLATVKLAADTQVTRWRLIPGHRDATCRSSEKKK